MSDGVITTDMYTTVERSIQQTLKAAITAAGKAYLVFNNMIDKKKIADCHAAVAIMRISDTPNFSNGGGTKAVLDVPNVVGGHIVSFNRQPWPDSYDLLYQIESNADNLDDLRVLEIILRSALPPRQPLYLWDSTSGAFTTEWIEVRYAGYINRDVPQDNIYNRIQNVRFEAKNFRGTTTVVPAITNIQVSVPVPDGNTTQTGIDLQLGT